MDSTSSPEALYDHPPLEKTVKTAHGDTAVHVYNSEGSETVIMTAGCGGRKEQFQEGRMAQRLASRYCVVTFDWYGHGESPASRDYNKESFLEQLHRVVDEFVPEGQRFHLYGFSMGCFLSLHFCALHPDRIDRVVLHSPWNGELGVFGPGTKAAARVPLLGFAGLAVIAHHGFPYCHDTATFKKIILDLGEGTTAWIRLLDGLSAAERPNDVFIICGEGEKPFHRLAQGIHEKLNSKSNLVSYPKAQHMTWCEDWNQPVGSFFRNNIFEFLTR